MGILFHCLQQRTPYDEQKAFPPTGQHRAALRDRIVGCLPDDAPLLRLASCVLIEAHDEWQVSDRRYLSEASMAQLTPPPPTALGPRHYGPQEVIDTAAFKSA